MMNGTTIASASAVTGVGTVTGGGWVVKSIGDYDGDGKADVFWKNDTALGGITYVWLMNGASISSANAVTGVSDFNWQVSGGGVSSSPKAPIVSSTSVTVHVLGVAASAVTDSVVALDPQNLPLTYSIKTTPQFGTTSITPSTGAFTYSIAGYAPATSDSFVVMVSNGQTQSTAQVNVQLASDPLLTNQWHIQNIGQNAFASVLPVAGNDMNVTGAWIAGYSGKGIKVGIADSGLEAAHEDLAANVDLGNSFNFLTGLHDPSPTATVPGFDHGTSVAGIIGAAAFNGKGGRGVAYGSRLRGYNFLAPGAFSIANMATSLGSAPISADNDLFNASFGATAHALPPYSGAYQAITGTTLTLRGGLGAAIVNAAGNDFQDWEYSPGQDCVTPRPTTALVAAIQRTMNGGEGTHRSLWVRLMPTANIQVIRIRVLRCGFLHRVGSLALTPATRRVQTMLPQSSQQTVLVVRIHSTHPPSTRSTPRGRTHWRRVANIRR